MIARFISCRSFASWSHVSRCCSFPLSKFSIIISQARRYLFLFSRSTDFEVHRNWLAITNSLPLSKWYYDTTSQWTLDYPPFFAWFQKFCSMVASLVLSPETLKLSATAIETHELLVFHRLTVIVSDVVYFYAVYEWINFLSRDYDFNVKRSLFSLARFAVGVEDAQEGGLRCLKDDVYWHEPRFMQIMLLLLSPGLILVDHIHFQYNGMLIGLFLLSIIQILYDKPVHASFFFTVLIHFKHIFIYAAPVFFVFILRNYCLDRHYNAQVTRFLKIALTVVGVTVVSIGPFVYHLPQLLSRLFPFKRGLTHSYWAPNFWAFYNFTDWILCKTLTFLIGYQSDTPVYMKGLVQEFDHQVLMTIRPWMTFVLTAAAMMPALIKVWKVCHFPSPVPPKVVFLRCLTLCCLASFLFSWHVHEKAILMSLLPLTLLTVFGDSSDCKAFLILSVTGTVSLFPLIPNQLFMIKTMLLLLYLVYAVPAINLLQEFFHTKDRDDESILLTKMETLYVWMFVPLVIMTCVVHPLFLSSTVPFLPLALTSLYCALGVAYVFIHLLRQNLWSNLL